MKRRGMALCVYLVFVSDDELFPCFFQMFLVGENAGFVFRTVSYGFFVVSIHIEVPVLGLLGCASCLA